MTKILTSLPHEINTGKNTYKLQVGKEVHAFKNIAKFYGIRTITRKVLDKNLRGKNDLHGKPYQPHEWIYFEVVGASKIEYLNGAVTLK